MRCKIFSLRLKILSIYSKNKVPLPTSMCLFLNIFVYLKGRMIGRDRKQSSIY